MSDERIAELQNFKTKDFSECPIQTAEQLQEFKPKYSAEIQLDADVLEWLTQIGPRYQTRANAILRQVMQQSS